MPKTIAVRALTASVKPRTAASIRMAAMRGRLAGSMERSTLSPPSARTRPTSAAGRRKHEALGRQLTHETPSPRAERRAKRHLVLPRRRAREQQVRHVGAGDEQDEPDGAEERHERRLRVLDDIVLERHDPDAHVGRLVHGVLLPELPGDAVHLGLRLLERHARLQPAEDGEEREVARRRLAVVESQRLPDLRVGDEKRFGREEQAEGRAA